MDNSPAGAVFSAWNGHPPFEIDRNVARRRCGIDKGRSRCSGLRSCAEELLVKAGVHKVEILLVHPFLGKAQTLAETLEVDDLPLPQELDDVVHIRVIAEPENVVVGYSCLLLWHAAKLTTIKNTNFEDKRLISAILLLIFLHFANSGLNGQALIVVKIYEKTRVTIHKEKASATSPKQCRIGIGQPYQKSLKAAGIPQWLSLRKNVRRQRVQTFTDP